ncbi:hypothetical protein CS0771_51710 [Catellatospora sp. IY07-71]|uniref:hypothetical protein n=1 Tax=Catellatospora sp. IY07-71 TaxID=2728827 RepID=UPI001BB43432|nr:hypothetical protein [Catellatospora sp. IY07-71]BCJ75627.1 hypothetical protein CS0771_51710 [Catellatospora sp. IY07-71]
MQGFARREFQLMLLRRMFDFQPDLVEAACAELGVSHRVYMAAHNRWQTMLRSRTAPKGLALYGAVLGPADERYEVLFGDARMTAHRWRLPGLWPDLRFEALSGAGDFVLHGWLVRAAGSPVPELGPVGSLAPWSCVVDDVLARFPGAVQRDPEVPARWGVDVPDPAGGVWRLMFVYGLLQQVSR